MCISLPIVTILALAGGPIVHLWMGDQYVEPFVLAILAAGHLFSMSQRGTYRILIGLNQHGHSGVAELGGAALATLLTVALLVWFKAGLIGSAIAIAIPVTLAGGLVPIIHCCRSLQIGTWDFLRQTVLGPVALVCPLALCLILSHLWCATNPILELAVGLGAGGAVTAALYWRYVVPDSLKEAWPRVRTCSGRGVAGAACRPGGGRVKPPVRSPVERH
jgi:hypothetical protein